MKIMKIKYLIDKIKRNHFEKSNSEKPWLNKNAVLALEGLIQKSDIIVECGSGRSSIWFAKNAGKLISIENSPEWYEIVNKKLKKAQLTNVDYHLVEYSFDGEQENTEYTNVIHNLLDNSIAFGLIDGGPRSYCAKAIIPKLKNGGILILDDAQYAFPSFSGVNGAFSNESDIPTIWNSTPLIWKEVYSLTRNWKRINTTDGITDTLFLIKP